MKSQSMPLYRKVEGSLSAQNNRQGAGRDACVPAGVINLVYGVPSEISEYLFPHPIIRIADEMEAEAEEIARTIALETGNALRTQARGEARLARRHLPLFRRARRRAEGRDDPARRAGAELYAARAARRRRRDHSVERAGAAGRAEDRARALRRQHAGAEGGRGRAARRAADGARSARSFCRPACSTC